MDYNKVIDLDGIKDHTGFDLDGFTLTKVFDDIVLIDFIDVDENGLIKKAIAAVLVFLVITIVTLLMTLIGDSSYTKCMKCINNPFDKLNCKTPSQIITE